MDTRVHLSEAEKLRFGWYNGCQATVWALEMILLESRSLYLLSSRTYTVFSKPEKAFKRQRRIPEHLTPGNVINNLFNFIYQKQGLKPVMGDVILKHCPLSEATLVLKLKVLLFRVINVLQFGYEFVTLRCNPFQVSKEVNSKIRVACMFDGHNRKSL